MFKMVQNEAAAIYAISGVAIQGWTDSNAPVRSH
jgi:hypothetical protein